MSFFHSIKFRFTLWYLVILGIALVSLSVGVCFYLARTLYQQLDASLQLRAAQLSNIREVMVSVAEGQFQEEIGEVVSFYFYSDDEIISISPRDMNIPIQSELVERAIDGESIFTTVRTADDVNLRVYATPFSLAQPLMMPGRRGMDPPMPQINIESAVLVVGRPTTDIQQALQRLRRILMIAVPLTLVAAGWGGVFLARRALKPVDEMTQKAKSIEEHDLSQRIEVKTKDELGRLATTLNEMIGRLEKAFKRQKQFTGDASHELRAPLAIIEAESTLTLQKKRSVSEYRRSLETIAQETKRMSIVIAQLLTLARADAGKEKMSFDQVDLSELLADLGTNVGVLCRDKGLDFQLDLKEGLVVGGDPVRLRVMFLNLLDNAIRYTPSGGTISLSLFREDQLAGVAISDSGIGIPPEDLPHVFDRFYRVDKARSRAEGGSGLGLAIAKHIAEAHGGKIEARSQVGEGTTFSVWLPFCGNI
jgi:heavy metal sensor kinase